MISVVALMMALTTVTESHAQQLPAFPGAEGFGMYTTGGRGGKVLHVTTLDDNAKDEAVIPGSLRWAIRQKGARTVVFNVSGTIHLKQELKIQNNDITIAGQSAPGDGICIADYPFALSADNIIIRYMRFRLGNKNVTLKGADGWDGLGGMDHRDIIIDHCSISWSIDECCSVYGNENQTVQWCIVSQSLCNAGHSKGGHGFGGNWGGAGASYHHNLLAHHVSRAPRLGPRMSTQERELVDLRNNVIYNWAGNGCYGGEGMNCNIVNNYYKPGPATLTRNKGIQKRIAQIGVRTRKYCESTKEKDNVYQHGGKWWNGWFPMLHRWGKFYIAGNVNPLHADVTNSNWLYGVLEQTKDDAKVDYTFDDETQDTIRLKEPHAILQTTTHTADEAYARVLDYAGASLHRDAVDALVVGDVREGKASFGNAVSGKDKQGNDIHLPGIIDTQDDIRPQDAPADWSPWPLLASLPAATDSDGDGMPDAWEQAHGLNPADAADGSIPSTDGYTNLEVYLNSLVADITLHQNEVTPEGKDKKGKKKK